MSQTIQANPQALIESVAQSLAPGAQEDARQLLTLVVQNLTAQAPGGNLIQIGGAQQGSSAPPTGVTFTASGANGVINVAIVDPSTAKPNTIWHEISYSTVVSFTQNVTTLPATTSTSVSISAPGESLYVRMRVSYDKQTWSSYQLASTSAIDAGLMESSAISAAATFNQTNFAEVNSTASGSAAAVTVSGPGGDLTSYTAVKGSTQTLQPSATIIGVPPATTQFVAQDSDGQFVLKPTLASVFDDSLTPVGAVSVVSTTAPSLPTIKPIVSSGYIIGYAITIGGSGASQPYTLTLGSVGSGAGAIPGPQTIENGVLVAIGPGNPGNGEYSSGTTLTASGGQGGAVTGGGTAQGNNGGRLTAVT